MGIFKRRKGSPVTVDDLGVTRRLGSSTESVTWSDLALVEVRTTSDGPFAEDVFWILHGRSGTGVVVPSSAAPDELLARLQTLPGFNNDVLIESMASTTEATFECWRSANSATGIKVPRG